MAKKYAQYAAIAGSLVPIAKTPLDNRDIVEYVLDLTDPDTWKADDGTVNWYVGMIVSVLDNNKTYKLVGNDPTIFSNWEQLSGSSDFSLTTMTFNGIDIVVVNDLNTDYAYSDPLRLAEYAYGNMPS